MAYKLPVHRFELVDEGLRSCITCRQVAEQFLLLRCLHSCCTTCADLAAIADGSKIMRCPTCDIVTDITSARHYQLVGRAQNGVGPQPLKRPEQEAFLKEARSCIHHLLNCVHDKSEKLLQPRNLVRDIQSARAIHLNELMTRKESAVDAVIKAFDDSEREVKDIYNALEVNALALQNLAEQLYQSVQHASGYVNSLADSADPVFLDQQETIRSRLEVVAKQCDAFREITNAKMLVVLKGSLPKDLNNVVASWMGTPTLTTDCLGQALAEAIACKDNAADCDAKAEQPALHFRQASSSFQSPVHCLDLCLTSEGHLLLATGLHGLKECSQSGSELSAWKAEGLRNGLDDWVTAVRSLKDRGAIIGLYHCSLVLLLKRGSAAAGEPSWLQDRRVAELQSHPYNLSVLGELLTVTGKSQTWLQLWRLSSGRLLYSRNYEYSIRSVALTATALVTTSVGKVELADGKKLWVVDSRSHRGDREWRYELSSEEQVRGVCAAGNLLYMAVLGLQGDASLDCVRELSAETGDVIRQVLSYHNLGLLRPLCLSLGRGPRTVLAVLCLDAKSMQWKNMTVYSTDAAA